MLKKLRENLKIKREKKLKDKPLFQIAHLKTAEIVKLESRTPTDHGSYIYEYRTVKDLAIIELSSISLWSYTHIESKQELREMIRAHIGDYAVDNVRDFEDTFSKFIRLNGLTKYDKLSYNQIVKLENEINTTKHNDKLANHLFGCND